MVAKPTILIYHDDAAEIQAGLATESLAADFVLAPTYADALAAIPNAHALFALDPQITEELVARAARLQWVQALTSGVECALAMPGLPANVVLTSMHGTHGPQVSELAILLMLALSRDFPKMIANQAARRWDHWRQRPLFKKTAVIVGVGAIGEHLANLCRAFDMTVYGVDAERTAVPSVDRMFAPSDLCEAAGHADFLIVLVPHLPSTHHLIDATVLRAMPRHGFLINVARGAVVDEAALIDALQDGTIAGAGLDVFAIEPLPAASPLWAMSNVIVTPHVGGNSTTYIQQMRDTLAFNIRAFADGQPERMRNRVPRPH